MNWMYWLAIGIGAATVIGGWLHSRYEPEIDEIDAGSAQH